MNRRPRIVPEAHPSSTRVCRQHFVQDPQVFMLGPIWQSVSFPVARDITDNKIYFFVAVLFLVDKNMRDGKLFAPLCQWRSYLQKYEEAAGVLVCQESDEQQECLTQGRWKLHWRFRWRAWAADSQYSGFMMMMLNHRKRMLNKGLAMVALEIE